MEGVGISQTSTRIEKCYDVEIESNHRNACLQCSKDIGKDS